MADNSNLTAEQIIAQLQLNQKAAEQELQKDADALVTAGRESFGSESFDNAADTIRNTLGDATPLLTDMVRQFDSAPAIIQHLADNTERLERLKQMPPARAMAELAAIQNQIGGTPQLGKVPAWKDTASRSGRCSDSDWKTTGGAHLTDAQWNKEFDRRQAARGNQPRVSGDAENWARRVSGRR